MITTDATDTTTTRPTTAGESTPAGRATPPGGVAAPPLDMPGLAFILFGHAAFQYLNAATELKLLEHAAGLEGPHP